MSGRQPASKPAAIARGVEQTENFLTNFWRTQITAPDKREGNVMIAVSTSVFLGAILLTRNFGDLLVPAFA